MNKFILLELWYFNIYFVYNIKVNFVLANYCRNTKILSLHALVWCFNYSIIALQT